MDHCGTNQVFDAVDPCSTTNLKTSETLSNFMAPSRKREEPNSELSLGPSSTERFKDEAIPDIRKSFFTITSPDITAEVCGADAKLFPPEVCGADVVGAFLGAVFGEVLKIVEEVTIKAVEFKPLLNRLQLTLNQIAPFIKDIEKLDWVLDWPQIETLRLADKLEEGKRLVQKCAKVRWWNLSAKTLYANRLIAFDRSLVSFFNIVVTAQISRDSRKIQEKVNEIDGRLERIMTRVGGGGGVQQEALPPTTAELSPYVDDCDDFEDPPTTAELSPYVVDCDDFEDPPTTAELSPYVVDCDDFEDFDDVDDSDDIDRSAGMLPNLEDEFVYGLLSSYGDERIIVSTTNHRDRHDAALLPLVNVDSYIHTSAPQPIALPDGGEIVQLESSEQKPLVDFDATNNRSCQREASMRPCMTESVLSLVDSVTRISSTDFDAPENRAHLVRAHQSGPIVFNSEKEDAGEGLNGECLTKSVLSSESSDDSTKQNSLPEFDDIENKVVKVYARRGRGCCHSMELEQVVTFAKLGTDPENEGIISDLLRFVRDKEFYKSIGKAWKRGYLFNDSPGTDRSGLIAAMANCLEFDIYDLDLTGLSSISELTHVLVSIRNRSFVVIKDFDHWIGMLPNLKNELTLSVIYDPGIHTTDSLAWKSFKVLETLPTWEQPNDCVPLLSLGRLTLKGCVQEEKSPDLPTVMQINGVEHRVKKLPTCLGGLTAQCSIPDSDLFVLDSNARKPFEERQELQFHTPDSLAWKSFEELNVLPLCKQSNCIRHVVPQRILALKHWVRLKKSQDLPGTVQMNCSRGLTTQVIWRPPDQHGEGNTSTTRETPSRNVQTGMEGEPVGQNQEANECRRDFMVSRPPDQHGERNTSTARETPSHNVQTRIEGVPVGQNQEANEFRQDFTENGLLIGIVKIPPFHDSYPGNYPIDYKERENAGSSFGWPSQVNDQSTLSNPHVVFPQAELFLDGHISGPSNSAFPTRSDQAAPSQHVSQVNDQSTLSNPHVVFPQAELFSDGHISGPSNSAFPTWSDQAAPSQHVEGQSMPSTVYPDDNAFVFSSQEPIPGGHAFESLNRIVTIKACYGEHTKYKFLFPLTWGIDDLKKEVSKRLNVEVDRFEVKYKDQDQDLISIVCNEDLMLYLWSSQGIDEIKVLVLDKVGGTQNFCEKCGSSMQTRA
ncbi:hypothetical protein RHGRI_013061 [Rhododendron griersonianum]|uniref:PB1 domain-containing protein n=1 Tax=Rhododendron griersonianum TaxID=479676 RepID=A0AAV6K4A4_9ERIC|nr:hypothetical protein RHGRI_013061 [Rhododendron griersonianum]